MNTNSSPSFTSGSWHRKLPFALAIFTGAFLIFKVQPVLARFILPWFGGSAGVWTVCMLFFQTGLLAGYAYSHILASTFSRRTQALIHGSLLLSSLLLIPMEATPPSQASSFSETIQIFVVLAKSVGIPFVLLSASAPLLQHWFVDVNPGHSPYRLYALSNAGSLIALLSYPFWFERFLSISDQAILWSAIYLLYVSLILWCCGFFLSKTYHPTSVEPGRTATNRSPSPTSLGQQGAWLGLSAMGSILLLSITNQMSQDVSVVPFLWVMPLSLYLITFIITFEKEAWYRRRVWFPVFAVSAAALILMMNGWFIDSSLNIWIQIAIFGSALFTSCMICHGELVRRKGQVEQLTEFYLHVAMGGVIGGLIVSVVAPQIFNGYWELPLVLLATAALIVWTVWTRGLPSGSVTKWIPRVTVVSGIMLMGFALSAYVDDQTSEAIHESRSFYGAIRVIESGTGEDSHLRKFRHGRIEHGRQLMAGTLRYEPISYYGANTPVDLVMNYSPVRFDSLHPTSALNVGVIGLGVGTVAAYARPMDSIRFYEIDADVERVARDYFTFLEDSRGAIEVVIGDGRRMLERELTESGPKNFDVLIVDAFSGDAIPMHLMTQEASDIYWRHLNRDGILIFHISNKYVDLTDVVQNLALHAGKKVMYVDHEGNGGHLSGSSWAIVTSNQDFLTHPEVARQRDDWDHALKPIVWSDDFSNLFDVIEW